jgi:hypothetical protein
MSDDETSLGMKISVDVESINKTSNEFLVNFDYLVKLMSEYGFDLVDSKLFHEVPSSMLEEFYAENKIFGPKLRNKPKVLEYSILHRWFIFVKRNIKSETEPETEPENNEDEVSPRNSPDPKPVDSDTEEIQTKKFKTLKDEEYEQKNNESNESNESDDNEENNQDPNNKKNNIDIDIKDLDLEAITL